MPLRFGESIQCAGPRVRILTVRLLSAALSLLTEWSNEG